AVVLERIADRLGNDRVSGEMHDGVDAMLGEELRDDGTIARVADDEPAVQDGRAKSRIQVVEDDDVFVAFAQLSDDVAADISRAAGHQNGHRVVRCMECRVGPRQRTRTNAIVTAVFPIDCERLPTSLLWHTM